MACGRMPILGVYACPFVDSECEVRMDASGSELIEPREPRLNLEISMSGWYMTSWTGNDAVLQGELPPEGEAECGEVLR